MNTYFIGGSPCSGKSTVAEILAKKYDLYYFKVDDFLDGTKFLSGTYRKLKKLFKGIKNIEIHHVIEKRFKKLFKKVASTDDYLSIPLTKELHKIITKRWRDYFSYGMDYMDISKTKMRKAIKQVYKDMPQLLDEALEWFEKNWMK